MATVLDIKTYVRTYLDVDISDMPDLFLDAWLQQGFNEMVAANKRWPSLEKDATFTTVGGQQDYVLGESGAITDCRTQDVEYVTLDDYTLAFEDHDRLKDTYTVAANVQGKPVYYSLWNGRLWLWPKPSTAMTVRVSYYRRPTAWLAVGAGSEPDLPDEFHLPLQEYVLAHAYLQQEDAELSDVHMKNFGRMFAAALKAELAPNPRRPLVLGGDRKQERPRRMRYPFDSSGHP